MSLQTRNNMNGIYLLWLNWVIVAGALSLLVIASLWLKPVLMPLLGLALFGCCWLMSRVNSRKRMPVCYLLPHIAMRVLFTTVVIMAGVELLYSRWVIHHVFDPEEVNTEIPFITVLIISPVTAFFTAIALYKGSGYSFCVACKALHGTPAERGFLGKLFTQEGTFQARTLCTISTLVTLVAYTYYFTSYVNVNLNSPDRFIFFIVPLAMFVLSIIYMAVRYAGLWNYYSSYITSSSLNNGPYTLVRYLILHDNTICVRPPEKDPDKVTDQGSNRYDTPGNVFIPTRDKMTVDQAKALFFNKTDTHPSDLRFLYSTVSGNADYNIFHFIVYINDEEKRALADRFPQWEFITLGTLRTLINSRQTNPLFSAEIIRLHTMAMAWKTYDHRGRRKYKIKHYQPTFRLCDIHKWDIDYNDPRWLAIADFNQDSPMFSIRRLWKKHFTTS